MFERCTLDIDLSVRHLCTKPYHNHPKGCPKYGKSILCPPEAPVITTIFNLQLPVYAIWTSYDLRLHTNRLKAKHPSWTWPQLVCCLYWQGSARRALRQECREFVEWRKRRDSIDRSLPAMVENLERYRGWCWDGRSKVPEFKGRKDWVLLEYLREPTGRLST